MEFFLFDSCLNIIVASLLHLWTLNREKRDELFVLEFAATSWVVSNFEKKLDYSVTDPKLYFKDEALVPSVLDRALSLLVLNKGFQLLLASSLVSLLNLQLEGSLDVFVGF
ncbi:hypothetical protein M0R45_025701 [Rubus argutus]|uniref:Uncharacterized protein n=1 Tax=Rubus argutus TaxID=59490 RepID=A0AAW1WW59_RUBAR